MNSVALSWKGWYDLRKSTETESIKMAMYLTEPKFVKYAC